MKQSNLEIFVSQIKRSSIIMSCEEARVIIEFDKLMEIREQTNQLEHINKALQYITEK